MTKKATTPAPVSAPAVDIKDTVRPALVSALVKCAKESESSEFAVWIKLAMLAEAGQLSVRGYQAHIEQANEQGAQFATIKAGQGQHLVAMLTASRLPNAPQSVSRLYTLVDGLNRIAPAVPSQSKAETVRQALEKAVTDKKAFAPLATTTATKVKALKPKPRAPRPNEGTVAKVESGLTKSVIVNLAKQATEAVQAGVKFDRAFIEAMRDLSMALDNIVSANE